MRLLFLGSPGVGKGTYAKVIEEALNIPHISAGDLLRDETKTGSDLGKEIKEKMDKGEFISDDIMLKLIEKRIQEDDCKVGWLLDGFPRNKVQAETLDKALKEAGMNLD